MIDTASGGDGGRLVDLIARLEKTYRRAVDDVNRATDRDIDRAARRKMLLEFGEPTAALRAAGYVVERDWQDISTAPRDGTEIDVWVGRWHDGSNFSEEAAWRMPQAYWDASMEMWCSETAHIAVPDDCATHWRPLPAPPGAAT